MEQLDHNQGVDMRAPKSRSRALRWAMRIMLIFCGILMAMVLLSEPRVASYAQARADQVGQYFTALRVSSDDQDSNEAAEIIPQPMPAPLVETKIETTAQAEPATVTRTFVRAMPTDRIPVRRALQSREN